MVQNGALASGRDRRCQGCCRCNLEGACYWDGREDRVLGILWVQVGRGCKCEGECNWEGSKGQGARARVRPCFFKQGVGVEAALGGQGISIMGGGAGQEASNDGDGE